MSSSKLFAFVLMPFDKAFDDIYKLGIKSAAEEMEIHAERVDEQLYSESMLERIYRQIDQCDFTIADLTGRNPNVFYEIGYAHAKGKLGTLLTQNAADIPFDLKHHRSLIYDGSISLLKDLLIREFTWLKGEASRLKEVPINVKASIGKGTFVEHGDYMLNGLAEISIELTNTAKSPSPDIESLLIYSTDKWEFKLGNSLCSSSVVEIDAKKVVRHFISTPVPRLSPQAWVPIKLLGEKKLWTKWSGEERQETYKSQGKFRIDVVTSKGTFSFEPLVTAKFDDVPF